MEEPRSLLVQVTIFLDEDSFSGCLQHQGNVHVAASHAEVAAICRCP